MSSKTFDPDQPYTNLSQSKSYIVSGEDQVEQFIEATELKTSDIVKTILGLVESIEDLKINDYNLTLINRRLHGIVIDLSNILYNHTHVEDEESIVDIVHHRREKD